MAAKARFSPNRRRIGVEKASAFALALASALTLPGFAAAAGKRWEAMNVFERERLVRANLRKASTALSWVRGHRRLYEVGKVRVLLAGLRADRRKATSTLRRIQDRIYFTGSWSQRYRVVRSIICSFDWSPTSCAGAVQVSRCETGGTFLAAPGDDPGSQYIGLFELGDYARMAYGVGSYRTRSWAQAGRAGAWDQVTGAYRLYVALGRSWSGWACRPDGSIAY